MLTHFGPHLNKIDRKTEQSDAHQNALRHQQNPLTRKKHDKKGTTALQSELATMSIDAICLYLESMIAPHDHQPAAASATAPHRNHINSRATNAYQQQDARTAPASTPNDNIKHSPISATEHKIIEGLLADLAALKENGVTHLTIQEGKNIFDSLIKAINLANASL